MRDKIEKLILKHNWKDIMFYDLNKLEDLYNKWIELLPKIKPYYAVKCNSNLEIIKKLHKLGTGFDCASKCEIDKVLKISNSPDQIIFSNPCKYEDDIRFALKNKVYKMTFDCIEELKKISKINKKIDLVLRIYANDKKATFNLSKKYGAFDYEWDKLFKTAKNLGLNIKGINFHIGSGAKNKKVYITALRDSKKCRDLGKKYGFEINLIDIGGGFSESKIEEFSEAINLGIDKYFKNEEVEFISEPGRYFAETIVRLYTKVFGKKEREGKYYYWISDGIYGCFNCQLHGEYPPNPEFISKNKPNSKKHSSTIFGPTCDIEDEILESYKMIELNLGDYIIWDNMGAYTIVASTDFNGMDQTKPMAVYIDGKSLKYHGSII